MPSTQGLLSVGVPPQPSWFLHLKIAILALSLIILALAAWAVAILGDVARYGASGAGGFMIFVTIWTFLTYGGGLAVELYAAQLFYRVGALVLYLLAVIFWLSGWAYSASQASAWLSIYNNWVGIYYSSSVSNLPIKNEGIALAACAGLGALVWVLTIVHLVFFVRSCLADPDSAGQAELGQVKPVAAPAPAPATEQVTPSPYGQQAQGPYTAQ